MLVGSTSSWRKEYQLFSDKFAEHYKDILTKYPQVAEGCCTFDCTLGQWKEDGKKVNAPWENAAEAKTSFWSSSTQTKNDLDTEEGESTTARSSPASSART